MLSRQPSYPTNNRWGDQWFCLSGGRLFAPINTHFWGANVKTFGYVHGAGRIDSPSGRETFACPRAVFPRRFPPPYLISTQPVRLSGEYSGSDDGPDHFRECNYGEDVLALSDIYILENRLSHSDLRMALSCRNHLLSFWFQTQHLSRTERPNVQMASFLGLIRPLAFMKLGPPDRSACGFRFAGAPDCGLTP